MIISKRFTFEASHILPLHPGKCSRLHGHSWGLRVSVIGPINDKTGMVMDYHILSAIVKTHIIIPLDHTHLGYGGVMCSGEAIPGRAFSAITILEPEFYPTSENLARKIFETLYPIIQKENPNVRLHEITIEETCTSAATYRAGDYAANNAYPVPPAWDPQRGPCPHCGGSGKA